MVIRRFAICIALALVVAPAALTQTTNATKKQAARSSPASAKLRHIHHAFVASADLKPMARQLLEERTPQAYAGVESYARKHTADPDASALAWLVLGYAHYVDKNYAEARAAWQHSGALEPVLGDYLAWLRASAYQGEGNPAGVLVTLETFEQKYPDSLNLHDVQLLYASALSASGQATRAAEYLEKRRSPYHADVELALARAYEDQGARAKSVEILRRVYFDQPLSPEAEEAEARLTSLGETSLGGTFEQRHARAEALLKAKRYHDASVELSPLVELAPTEKIRDLELDYATALYKEHRQPDAQRVFENVLVDTAATGEEKAQALYFLAEVAREKDDTGRQAELISQLRAQSPSSSWFQEALLSAGNGCILRHDLEGAARFYAEIYQRQQNGRYAATAHWKTAWLMYRMGKKDEARKLFDEQLELYPSSMEAPAALYWRGRLSEDLGDHRLARAYYRKLAENYRYFYYANLGRERLATLGLEDVDDPPSLTRLAAPPAPPRLGWDTPESNLRAQKAQLLANAALYDFAVRELQSASPGSPPWQAASIAGFYQEQGSYIHAIDTLKRAIPGYFSADIGQLPRPVWEGLFPRAFWEELKRNCQKNGLDPYLVASLIRQESEFNPSAISRANAMGLMQLLPSVGKSLAREEKIKRFSRDQLLEPATNLELGTRYFKKIVDHYDGHIAYALAAYNAGENRVADWQKNGDFKDVEEFVESIPFTETREYVQAILRNAVLYRLLYPKG
ncbi:MAG TPA: transglycosylase SLT domain-containing protein [Terriglobales bacterium]